MNLQAGFTLVEFLLFLILGVIVVWLATLEYRLFQATRTVRVLFSGRGGANLEQRLHEYLQRMDRSDKDLNALNTRSKELDELYASTVQHVGVIRFNPFKDTGGDQSFAVAILDGRLDGVVFSGLHSRGDSRVYAKPVVGGASNYPLTEEERQAISRAGRKS